MGKRPLVPSFLQQFDTRLLKHTPAAWSARTHLVVYFVLLFAIVLAVACKLLFTDARLSSNTGVWTTFTALAAFTGFVIWMIFLLRFNVFKRYAVWKKWEGLQMFTLYFIAIASLVFMPYIPNIIECVNANKQYTDAELVDDINEFNLSVSRLEYNNLPKQLRPDTIELVKALTAHTPTNEAPVEDVAGAVDSIANEPMPAANSNAYRPHYQTTSDTGWFFSNINAADSNIKISDSVYVRFEAPDYLFVRSYYIQELLQHRILTSYEIYCKAIKNYSQPNRQDLFNRVKALNDKYATGYSMEYYEDGNGYKSSIEKKYYARYINRSIDNIAQKKFWWQYGWQWHTRFFLYCSLIITVLVFIFRHTTVKTFFLSLLTAVILLIGTGVIIGVFRWHNKGTMVAILLYYVLFFVLALLIKAGTIRNVVQGIALNFAVLLTPFIPLVATTLYIELLQTDRYNNRAEKIVYVHTANWYLYAEIAGLLLLLIGIEPLFRKLYKRWYALPEE